MGSTGSSLVEVITDLGAIRVELHNKAAPVTCDFVSRQIVDGRYDGTAFYRTTTLGRPDRDPLIQGGPWSTMVCDGGTKPELPLLTAFETTAESGLRHCVGSVSLARDLLDSGHAMPDWFICLDDYPDLNESGRDEPDTRGFPVFGTVVAGLNLVHRIAAQPAGASTAFERLAGEVLHHPVAIREITTR